MMFKYAVFIPMKFKMQLLKNLKFALENDNMEATFAKPKS